MKIISSALVLVTSLNKLGFGLSQSSKPVDANFLQEKEGWFGGGWGNGSGCAFDYQCESGRCASNLECADKLELGGSCLEDDDCASDQCSWGFVCIPLCETEETIPFMVTNVELTQSGTHHYWGRHAATSADEMQFLKNIRHCADDGHMGAYRIYGELITPEEFKAEVEEYVRTNDVDHVLYQAHGVCVDPKGSFGGAYRFNEAHSAETGYLVIPINWRSLWLMGIGQGLYEISRNEFAPVAGRQLADKIDVFASSSSVPTSLMAHSMGNFVSRVMAQDAVTTEPVFQNYFMVAADARMDMYSTEFNPDAPTSASGIEVGEKNTVTTNDLEEQVYLDLPDHETRLNGGYAITRIVANKIHVIWNSGDVALAIREAFQISWAESWPGEAEGVRKAIGKFGDRAEELTTSPYFQARVQYHDFSQVVDEIGLEHSYQWYEPTVEVYTEYKSQATTTMSIVSKGGLRVD